MDEIKSTETQQHVASSKQAQSPAPRQWTAPTLRLLDAREAETSANSGPDGGVIS